MKDHSLHLRSLLIFCSGLVMFAIAAPVFVSGSIDPVSVKDRVGGWPGGVRAGIAVGSLVFLSATLDAAGRCFGAAALRFRKGGDDSPRISALFRLAFLAAVVGGATLCLLFAQELFPQPSTWWAKPCLLGAALVPVAVALRATWRARKSMSADCG